MRVLKKVLDLYFEMLYKTAKVYRGIAQLVEHRSPKPSVVSSNLTAPAKLCKSSEMATFSFIFNNLTESVWQVLKNSLSEQLHGPIFIAFLKN